MVSEKNKQTSASLLWLHTAYNMTTQLINCALLFVRRGKWVRNKNRSSFRRSVVRKRKNLLDSKSASCGNGPPPYAMPEQQQPEDDDDDDKLNNKTFQIINGAEVPIHLLLLSCASVDRLLYGNLAIFIQESIDHGPAGRVKIRVNSSRRLADQLIR